MSGRLKTWLTRKNESFAGRLVTTALLIGITMPLYMLLNRITPRFDLSLPLDQDIPFLPWTIVIYLSFYALLLIAAGLAAPDDFSRIQKSVLAANFLCYAGFLLLPSHYPRPLPETAGAFEGIYRWLHANDAPGNTFPSIHAAASLCVAFGLGRFWRIWGVAVALSILTVKQHFLADLLGGAAVAVFSMWIVKRYESRKA